MLQSNVKDGTAPVAVRHTDYGGATNGIDDGCFILEVEAPPEPFRRTVIALRIVRGVPPSRTDHRPSVRRIRERCTLRCMHQ